MEIEKSESFDSVLSSGSVPPIYLSYLREFAEWREGAHSYQVYDLEQGASLWLLLGGRGAGKTKALNWKALHDAIENPEIRIIFIVPTTGDLQKTTLRGEDGILTILERHGIPYDFNASSNILNLDNGSRIMFFSAESPDRLRGPQCHLLFADEYAAWATPSASLDVAVATMRLPTLRGEKIKNVISMATTPRPLIRELLTRYDGDIQLSRATTMDNAANLGVDYVERLGKQYGEGTSFYRQEVLGEIIYDVDGAIFPREFLASLVKARDESVPLGRVIVGVDPAASSGTTGIVVVGEIDGVAWALKDFSMKASDPSAWARAVVAAYHEFSAESVVVEINQGGKMVGGVIRDVDDSVVIDEVVVTSRDRKWVRAQRLSAKARNGKLFFANDEAWDSLHDELSFFTHEAYVGRSSPDRADALGHAVDALLAQRRVISSSGWVWNPFS